MRVVCPLVLLAIGTPAGIAQTAMPVAMDPLADCGDLLRAAADTLNLELTDLAIPVDLAFERTPPPRLRPTLGRTLRAPLTAPRLAAELDLAARAFAANPSLTLAFRASLRLVQGEARGPRPQDLPTTRTAGEALNLLVGARIEGATRLTLPGRTGEALHQLFRALLAVRRAVPQHASEPLSANLVPVALLRLDRAIRSLRALGSPQLPGAIRAADCSGDVRVRVATPAGAVLIGGPGKTRYWGEPLVIIDFGGDDVYEGRVAASRLAQGRPVGLVVDLGGNDVYSSKHGPTQGAAEGGIGLLVDLGGGRDTYRGTNLCQGAARRGLGMLMDDGGDDLYQAVTLAQGAAEHGTGVLADVAGDDTYIGHSTCQGAANAGFATVLDVAGNDNYRARSNYAQGAARGEPGRGGGVAWLWDGHGDDRYDAGGESQARASNGSFAALIDVDGTDQYSARGSGQGAASDLSVAVLWDHAGNDCYLLRPAGGRASRPTLGQGAARGFAIGVLLDDQGADHYLAGSGAQGSASAAGIALLIDKAGDDTFGPSTGTTPPNDPSGAIAMLIDAAGDDRFGDEREGKRFVGEFRRAGAYGLTWDLGRVPRSAATAAPATTRRQPASLPTEPGDKARLPAIRALLSSPTRAERRRGVSLVRRMHDAYSKPILLRLARDDEDAGVRRQAARALGTFADPAVVPIADALAKSPVLLDRRCAAQSLATVPGKQALHRLCDLLGDKSRWVRDPARRALVLRRTEALAVGLIDATRVDARTAREWLTLFSAWAVPPDCIAVLDQLSASKNTALARQAQALLAKRKAKRNQHK